MKLVVTEKNDAAQQIARLLSESGRPKADKVYDTPVYRFTRDGEDWAEFEPLALDGDRDEGVHEIK